VELPSLLLLVFGGNCSSTALEIIFGVFGHRCKNQY
jgi:hypothetical protein